MGENNSLLVNKISVAFPYESRGDCSRAAITQALLSREVQREKNGKRDPSDERKDIIYMVQATTGS